MGGATPKFKAEGLHVAVLDPTDGEPTSCGPPEFFRDETAEATRIFGFGYPKKSGVFPSPTRGNVCLTTQAS